MQLTTLLDNLYEHIDFLMRTEQFSVLDFRMKCVDIKTEYTEVLLGWLTATLPAKSKLPFRPEMYKRIESELNKRKQFGLLEGLK